MTAYRAIAGFLDGERHARHRQWLSRIFVAAMLGYLFWRLRQIGWWEIWGARPRSPLFYLMLVAGYFILPLADTAIYRRLLGLDFGRLFPALLRKRIYNAAVLGYSGELFLMMWARRRVTMPDARLAHLIKDSNILSAVASTAASGAVLMWMLATLEIGHGWLSATALVILLAPVVPLLLLFRWRLVLLDRRTAAFVLAIHLGRFLATQLLQLGQWWIALPAIGMAPLAKLLALQMIVSRLPLLPNRDLLFVGAGFALSGPLAIPKAALAGLLIMTSVLQQLLHLLVFIPTYLHGGERRPQAASCAS